MSAIIARFRSLPRAARWAALALALFAGFFLGVEPSLDAAAQVSDRADRREAMLRWLDRESSRADGEISRIRTGVERFGRVDPPGDPRQRSEQLSEALTRILDAHGVREQTTTSRTIAVSTGPLMAHIPPEQVLQRLVVDVQFDASPEAVARIVADLEQEACVVAVSRITMRRSEDLDRVRRTPGGLVRAGITVEAWILAAKGGISR